MAHSSYDQCLARLLVHEGGYTNHPSDPGGPTNFGITIYDYRKYVKPGANAADVRAMKLDDGKAIYRAKYWDALCCDELPAGVDDSVFDYGVNSGTVRSGKVLRRVLGLPDKDWHVTDDVLRALSKRDPKAVIIAINDERLRFLRSLKTWPVFAKGWGARVVEVKAFSLQLADRAAEKKNDPINLPNPRTDAQAAGKGVVPMHPSIRTVVDNKRLVAHGTGTVGTGFIAVARNWVSAHPAETIAFALAGAAVIGGAIYAVEHLHKSKQEAPTPGMVPVSVAA